MDILNFDFILAMLDNKKDNPSQIQHREHRKSFDCIVTIITFVCAYGYWNFQTGCVLDAL